jgi:hypothetical protein
MAAHADRCRPVERSLSLAVCVAVALCGRAAGAEDEPAACRGQHSLASPLPDRCMGLIDTDRPHQTDTPHVVPAGHVQLESALGEVQLGGTVQAPSREAHLILFDDNYKVGLVSRVDLQLLFAHAIYDLSQQALLPPGPLQVRAKFNVVEERGWVPAITLVPWVYLPVAPSEVLRGGPLVFWGWELPAHFELEMNAGVLFGASPKPPAAVVLATALTYKVVENFGAFIDIYMTGPDTALGTGLLWAFTRDAQVDVGTYVGVHGDEPIATPFVGLSVRR